jgi:RimJ/RimL family protein N-acetyltransferase
VAAVLGGSGLGPQRSWAGGDPAGRALAPGERDNGCIDATTITTDRLDMLPLLAEHAGEMAVVLADPRLYAFTGGVPPTAPVLRSRYERLNKGSPDPAVSWCNWVIKLREPGCLAGMVQATITSGAHGSVAEIAWIVGTPWQGRGIATEAAKALITWLTGRSVVTVIAHIHPDNHASAAVAAAARLEPTGEWQEGERRWIRRITP